MVARLKLGNRVWRRVFQLLTSRYKQISNVHISITHSYWARLHLAVLNHSILDCVNLMYVINLFMCRSNQMYNPNIYNLLTGPSLFKPLIARSEELINSGNIFLTACPPGPPQEHPLYQGYTCFVLHTLKPKNNDSTVFPMC